MTSLGSWLRRHGGLAALVFASTFALGRVLYEPMPGHYRIFVSAARELLAGRNPYGTNYGTGIGDYFYSIFCAWSVFAPLSLLPEKLGVFVYVVGAGLLFVTAVRRLSSRFGWAGGWTQLFFFMIAGQVFGAILSTKLELLMAGLLLWSADAWLDPSASRRRTAVASILLAAVLNWKYQPIPILGLLALACVAAGRRRREWAILLAAAASFALAPYLVYPAADLAQWYAVWGATFEGFVRSAFLNFENVFSSFHFVTGRPVAFETSQLVTAAAAAALAAGTAALLWREPAPRRWPQGALLALAGGTAFIIAFSPLGQNNAMILYAPLLWVAIGAAQARRSRGWYALLALTWTCMTWGYSDLTIWLGLRWLRDAQIKPWTCIALAGAIGMQAWRRQPLFPEAR